MAPVLAAGVGIRHSWTWVLRVAGFRLDPPAADRPTVGIAVQRDTAGPGGDSAAAQNGSHKLL